MDSRRFSPPTPSMKHLNYFTSTSNIYWNLLSASLKSTNIYFEKELRIYWKHQIGCQQKLLPQPIYRFPFTISYYWNCQKTNQEPRTFFTGPIKISQKISRLNEIFYFFLKIALPEKRHNTICIQANNTMNTFFLVILKQINGIGDGTISPINLKSERNKNYLYQPINSSKEKNLEKDVKQVFNKWILIQQSQALLYDSKYAK